MKSRLLKRVVKSQKYQILTSIKKSNGGLSVAELCEKIGLSYMGIKQHCISLEKDGYLDCWRRPKGMGRPEKAYRLTALAQEFFPTQFTELTLSILAASDKMFGPSSGDKVLYSIYQDVAEDYLKKIKASDPINRAHQLASLRDDDGYMSEVIFKEEEQTFEIVEYNSPVIGISDHFPIIQSLEEQLFQKVLGMPVKRSEQRTSGLYKCTFQIDSPIKFHTQDKIMQQVAVA
ncbi:MAG: winged helix-turn-helix transcriptional regulator [Verrucomicrobiota bacterium]|nr:winged helix-turn-helix transcriptional regulator [Verrucomicrobiota bacterium]